MKFFATLAALGAFSATVLAADPATYDCTGDTVKIASKCMCKSGYYWKTGTTCEEYAANGCQGGALPIPSANTTNSIADVVLADNLAATADTSVEFQIKLPMAAGRQFTAVFITDTTGTAPTCGFSSFDDISQAADSTSNGVTSVCADKFTLLVKFSKLLQCGFVSDNTKFGTPASNYQRFGGVVRLSYTDSVVMGTQDTNYAQTITRTSTVDYPVVVDLESQYTYKMTVNDVRVFAEQNVDFAISGQTISKDTTVAPKVDVTYAIQYPYMISAFGNCDTAAGNNLQCVATLGSSQCDFTANDYVTSGARLNTCTKTDSYLTFTNSRTAALGTCQFTGNTYTLAFTVACGTNVPDADCPLLAADSTGNSVVFTITSENFCVPQTTTNVINNVIDVTEFKAVSIADFVTPKTAWRYNDVIFFRMKFTGLLMNTVKLTKLERYYSTTQPGSELAGDYTEVAAYRAAGIQLTGFYDDSSKLAADYLNDANNAVQNPLPASLAGLSGKKFNLQQETGQLYQVYRFALVANNALLGPSALRGETKYMKLKATIDVTYDRGNAPELSNARRRRRQATAGEAVGGQGSAESETQSITAPETAAVAPNSGVRAAPAVALVLAILSAVALL